MSMDYSQLKKLEDDKFLKLKKLSNPLILMKEELSSIISLKLIIETTQVPNYVTDSKCIVDNLYTGWIKKEDLSKLDEEPSVIRFAISEKLHSYYN